MLPTSTNGDEPREPLSALLLRKAKEQPLVPTGVVLTCSALYLSARALRARDSRLANRMFFWRVGFQAFTVAALVGGGWYYGTTREERKSREEKLRELAKQREKLWIEELERIEEDAQKRRKHAEEMRLRLQKYSEDPSAEAAEASETKAAPQPKTAKSDSKSDFKSDFKSDSK